MDNKVRCSPFVVSVEGENQARQYLNLTREAELGWLGAKIPGHVADVIDFQACTAALSSPECGRSDPPECGFIRYGTAVDGEICVVRSQCLSGQCNGCNCTGGPAACQSNDDCSGGEGCSQFGTCVARVEVGVECDNNCQAGGLCIDGICIRENISEGDECSGGQCGLLEPKLACVFGTCTPAQVVNDGTTCGGSNICAGSFSFPESCGLANDGNFTCSLSRVPGFGESCQQTCELGLACYSESCQPLGGIDDTCPCLPPALCSSDGTCITAEAAYAEYSLLLGCVPQ
jgi:hypothetical protein